jgi:predicted dehydrogenase
MGEAVKVAVLGLGRSGWSIHAEGIEQHPNFDVVAVADPDAARREEAVQKFGCAAYATPEEAIADANVELVVVATPSFNHAALSILALESGKDVLCEKPMATNLQEADAMIEAAQKSGKVLSVYQVRRFDAQVVKMQEVLASGKLGEIYLVRLAARSFSRRRDWQTLRKFGGGQLNNWGAHLVDQALMFSGGQWRDLYVDLKHTVTAGDADDHVKLVFKGENDVTYDIEITSACAFSLPSAVIMGKYGTLIVDENGAMKIKYYDPAALPQDIVAEEGPAANRAYGSGEVIPWQEEEIALEGQEPRKLFYDKFYATLREGAPLVVTPEQVRNQMAMFEEAHRVAGI